MRLLTLIWPHLPLRLALGRDPGPEESVILGGRPWDPGSVLDGDIDLFIEASLKAGL